LFFKVLLFHLGVAIVNTHPIWQNIWLCHSSGTWGTVNPYGIRVANMNGD